MKLRFLFHTKNRKNKENLNFQSNRYFSKVDLIFFPIGVVVSICYYCQILAAIRKFIAFILYTSLKHNAVLFILVTN